MCAKKAATKRPPRIRDIGEGIDPVWAMLVLRPFDGYEFPNWTDFEDAIFLRVGSMRRLVPSDLTAWGVMLYGLEQEWVTRHRTTNGAKESSYHVDFAAEPKGVFPRD